MSFCKFTELLAADSPDGVDTIVPFSQTAAGKYLLTTHFIEFAQDHRSATPPTTTAVNALLVTLDSQTFPFNASEEDAVGGERLKAHSRLATLLWRTLIASCPTNPIQPAAVPSPLKNEKLALAATIKTQHIRILAHSAAGASTGVAFFNECLELQTQRVLVQCTITIEAAICSIAALHSLSAVDADGNPLTLDQVVELTPPVPTEPAAISKGLADNVRELKRESKYLYDSVKLATRVPGINGYHVLQELEHRLRSDLDELACDPSHVYKTTFAEQAEAAG